MSIGSVFSRLRGGDSIFDPLILDFGEQNPLPTAGAIGSVGSRSGSIGSSGWVGSSGSLDSPKLNNMVNPHKG